MAPDSVCATISSGRSTAGSAHGASLWWAPSDPGASAPLLLSRGLPDGQAFSDMLLGPA